jgi:FkbM family methyltransferase
MLRTIAKRVLPNRVLQFIKESVNGADSSQSGETVLLKKLAAEFSCEKWIIDVGANDGVTISNSLPFVELGWRAILIEPAPAVFKRLAINLGTHDNATCLQLACSDKSGEADLYFGTDGEDGLMSTLCRTDNEWFKTTRTAKSVSVKTETITHILKQHHAPTRPGILLVDCEGMDYEALLGLDSSQFRPTVIATEEYEWEAEKHAAKYGLLIRANYSLVQKVGCNTVWIDRSTGVSARYHGLLTTQSPKPSR